jgi:hypothetical protein
MKLLSVLSQRCSVKVKSRYRARILLHAQDYFLFLLGVRQQKLVDPLIRHRIRFIFQLLENGTEAGVHPFFALRVAQVRHSLAVFQDDVPSSRRRESYFYKKVGLMVFLTIGRF